MESIYKFKYERDGKVYASKDMLPSEDDVLLISRDALEGGKFKYEKDGKLYASTDMLPSEDDTLLIDRDVLEGKKEPTKPEPIE